ncbi:hypothetical protein TPHA_0C03750 [Tetrapisispora phaffii CBS 4417]|uniref:Dolichyl-phosphate-mannose--protein mannosyltransferase n=1 Tax=Tetrapisispora phaffii (strain ATCC 24235 / CBS 4417 / NBRC 1672 / NRRL Y-8282 / UCD 70-5) TaxID=1071381 RepID=G8BQL5_TETPH|nr:hypothetical protein TPHA_0C03750 [Tetrapisispora phaffii CBS 4417]CCE62527.1 hypothetical protein TPHA_0C03750 [Tetrapisispora phaffii CBS 4417]
MAKKPGKTQNSQAQSQRASKKNKIPADEPSPSLLQAIDQDPVLPFEVKDGPERPFLQIDTEIDEQTDKSAPDRKEKIVQLRTMNTKVERLLVLSLVLIASYVRLKNLSWPNSVVFDEVHFGKFAAKYVKNQFFFDVHPPLAKMLFAYFSSMAGFKGDFLFSKIGEEFPSDTPYVFMRLFAAVSGLFTVLLMYFTLRSSGIRMWVAYLVTLCFAVENSFVTISRYILLDSPLMLFIAAAAYAFKKSQLYPALSFNGSRYLLATGVALGFAVASKWVGLFTIAWVGALCAIRLMFYLGDLTIPISKTIKIALSKLIFLLVVPFILYATFFYVHFETLINDGDGSAFFSPGFRMTLKGNNIPQNVYSDVGVGSVVTLRHLGTHGGYLHSHTATYETGSKQQQVTCYGHLDDNNKWLIELANRPGVTLNSFQNITDGEKIKLFHINTQHRLHSHDHKPPVSSNSDWQKEISCYGFAGFNGDWNDDWTVEIDKRKSTPGDAQKVVKAIDTKFRLRHSSGCYLFSHKTKLPKWGFEQQEVTCAHSGKPHLTLWQIEGSESAVLPSDSKRTSYSIPNFWSKFIESHKVMWNINKGLTATHVYQSYPQEWPLLQRGISYWGNHNRQVYLFGNAILWWSVSFAVVLFAIVSAVELILWHLGSPVLNEPHVMNYHIQYVEYILGFLAHYIPSFLMQRQMFLHHYLPAYYFGILAFAHAFDITVTYVCKKKRVGQVLALIFTIVVVAFYYYYSPIIYGTEWTKEQCKKTQWFHGWDYNCNGFVDDLTEYATIPTTTTTTAAETAAAAAAN